MSRPDACQVSEADRITDAVDALHSLKGAIDQVELALQRADRFGTIPQMDLLQLRHHADCLVFDAGFSAAEVTR